MPHAIFDYQDIIEPMGASPSVGFQYELPYGGFPSLGTGMGIIEGGGGGYYNPPIKPPSGGGNYYKPPIKPPSGGGGGGGCPDGYSDPRLLTFDV
jgi:hypothetical protein